MNVRLYTLIIGCFGAGKSTLARNLLNMDGGWKNYESCAVSNGGLFTCAGRYLPERVHGGADFLKDTRGLPQLVENASTPCFLVEGQRATCFGPSCLVPMFSAPAQLGVYLRGSEKVLFERLNNRGSSKTEVGKIKMYVKRLDTLALKFAEIGVRVVQVDVDRNSPDDIAAFVFSEIQRSLQLA